MKGKLSLVLFAALVLTVGLVTTSFAQTDSLNAALDTTDVQLQNVTLGSQTATALASPIKLVYTKQGGHAIADSLIFAFGGTFKFSADSMTVSTTGRAGSFVESSTGKIGADAAGVLKLAWSSAGAGSAGEKDTITVTGAQVLPVDTVASNAGTTIDELVVRYKPDGGVLAPPSDRLKGIRLLPGSTYKFVWSTALTGTKKAGESFGAAGAVLDLQDFFGNLTKDKTTTPTVDAVVDATGSTGSGTMLNTGSTNFTRATDGGRITYNALAYSATGTYRIRAAATGIQTGTEPTTTFIINPNDVKNVTVSLSRTTMDVTQTSVLTIAATDTFFNPIDNQARVTVTEQVGGGGAFVSTSNFTAVSGEGTGALIAKYDANENSGTFTYTPFNKFTGTVTIKVEAQKDSSAGSSIVFSTTRDITVNAGPAATLSISPSDTSVAVNTTTNFTVQIQDAFGNQRTTVSATEITAAAKSGKGSVGTIVASGSVLLVPYGSVTTRDIVDTLTATLVVNSFQASSIITTRSGPPATISLTVSGDSSMVASRAVNSLTVTAKAEDSFGNNVNGSLHKLKFSALTAGASGSWKGGARGASAVEDSISAAIADSVVLLTFYSDTTALTSQVGVLYPTTTDFASASVKSSVNITVKPSDSTSITATFSPSTPVAGQDVTITAQFKDTFNNNIVANDSSSIDYAKIVGNGTLAAATTRTKTAAGTIQIKYTTFATAVDTAKIVTTAKGNTTITDTVTIISVPSGALTAYNITRDTSKVVADSVTFVFEARDDNDLRIFTYLGQGIQVTLNNSAATASQLTWSYFNKQGQYKTATGSALTIPDADSVFQNTDAAPSAGKATVWLTSKKAESGLTVTVSDTSAPAAASTSGTFKFVPGGVTKYTIATAAASTQPGNVATDTVYALNEFTITVTPLDALDNVNTVQEFDVNFTSNPSLGNLPAWLPVKGIATISKLIAPQAASFTIYFSSSAASGSKTIVAIAPVIGTPGAISITGVSGTQGSVIETEYTRSANDPFSSSFVSGALEVTRYEIYQSATGTTEPLLRVANYSPPSKDPTSGSNSVKVRFALLPPDTSQFDYFAVAVASGSGSGAPPIGNDDEIALSAAKPVADLVKLSVTSDFSLTNRYTDPSTGIASFASGLVLLGTAQAKDGIPPSAPADLRVVDDPADNGLKVTATFTKASDDGTNDAFTQPDGSTMLIARVTGYNVYDENDILVATLPAGVSSASFDAADRSEHTYRIAATDGANDSPLSNSNSATAADNTQSGDFNSDRTVDVSDFVRFAANFGKDNTDPEFDPLFDLNNDDVVDVSDFVIFAGVFGQSSPAPASSPALQKKEIKASSAVINMRTESASGDNLRVIVEGEQMADLKGYQFELKYDKNKLQLESVEAGSIIHERGLFLDRKNEASVLVAGAAFADVVISGKGVLASYVFKVKDPIDAKFTLDEILMVDTEGGLGSVESVSADVKIIPTEFALSQNYPNPFNPETQIRFDLPLTANVTLVVYDITGREVRTLVNGPMDAGVYRVIWDGMDNSGSNVSSGMYFYRVVADKFSQVKKMLLLK